MTGPCRESIVLCLSLVSVVARAQEVGEPLCHPENLGRTHVLGHLIVDRTLPNRYTGLTLQS
jgi:hypothetical protein